MEYEEEMEFSIVGSTEANSLKGKISRIPGGTRADRRPGVGDIVNVESPAGAMEYKVLTIERNIWSIEGGKNGRTAEAAKTGAGTGY